MKLILPLMMLAVLAGCGADGPPLRPSLNLGAQMTPDGVTPFASAGVSAGPLSIGLDL